MQRPTAAAARVGSARTSECSIVHVPTAIAQGRYLHLKPKLDGGSACLSFDS